MKSPKIMKPRTRAEKDVLVRAVKELAERFTIPPDCPFRGACLYYATTAAMKLSKVLGERCILQAGTAKWPRIDMATDDGRMNTHFSYVFDPDDIGNLMNMAQGLMPEMHCWVAFPRTQEILDVTAGWQKAQCEELAGMIWTAPPPPDYIWERVDQMPDGVVYSADAVATTIAREVASRLVCWHYKGVNRSSSD